MVCLERFQASESRPPGQARTRSTSLYLVSLRPYQPWVRLLPHVQPTKEVVRTPLSICVCGFPPLGCNPYVLYTNVSFTFSSMGCRVYISYAVCSALSYSIMDTDGKPSVSPRVDVESGLVRQITLGRQAVPRGPSRGLKAGKGATHQNKDSWRPRSGETIDFW